MQTAEILVKSLASVYNCHSPSLLSSTLTWVDVDIEKAASFLSTPLKVFASAITGLHFCILPGKDYFFI